MPIEEKPYRLYWGGRSRRELRLPANPQPPLIVSDDSDHPFPDDQLDPGEAPDMPGRPAGSGATGVGLDGDGPVPEPLGLPTAGRARPPTGRRLRRGSRTLPPHVPGPAPLGRRIVWRAVRWSLGLAFLAALALIGWGVAGYFAIRGGVADANERLGAAATRALAPTDGSMLSTPTTLLLLGIDTGGVRKDAGRADAIVLVRTDPDEHRVAMLSIPRDLRVPIPGQGVDKVNAAYALGGIPLLVRTLRGVLGENVPINHAVVVNFNGFPRLIDRLGGVTVDIPKAIRSNKFDCPFPSASECEAWTGWRFAPGRHTLSGRRALVYSRIRENANDPRESDITRGGRQQQVIRAIVDELVSVDTYMRLPFVGGKLTEPVATDLSTTELFQLAWVEFRAPDGNTLRCRLGGTPSLEDGISYIVGGEDNVSVVNQFLGRGAPQPPPADGGPFAAGCVTAAGERR